MRLWKDLTRLTVSGYVPPIYVSAHKNTAASVATYIAVVTTTDAAARCT